MPNDQFSAADLIGSVVDDRFEVIEKLGEGGMGAVYKARQISMDRKVALKILLHDQRGDPISVERFRHEAYLASRLRHPNAIIIHDFGQAPDGLLYIAMEYLSGETLKHRMSRVGPLPVRSAVKIIGQTLRTIAEAHRMGLIHRDLKPDNIFLTTVEGDTDYVKVLDFGIAKLTAVQDGIGGYQGGLTVAGKIYGTPNYMSPEQIRGKPVDHQSDLYQLGVLFYEMLAGRRPFEAQTPVDVMMMHLRDPPPPLSQWRSDVPPELEQTVLRVLEKDRRLRFQSGDEFLEALENFKFASGFYNVPARMAAMSSRSDMPAQPQFPPPAVAEPDPHDDSILELGQSALMDAMDFVEEKTMLEFDDDGGGFDDPDEKTVFEPDDDDDMITSAEPAPGIASMRAAASQLAAPPRSTLSQGTPREPSMLDVSDDFGPGDPSHIVPIPDIEQAGGRARPAVERRTMAGLPGANSPRYVTGAPAGGAVPQKPTLAGHPGLVGPPPPRAAAPGSPATIPHAGAVVPGMMPSAAQPPAPPPMAPAPAPMPAFQPAAPAPPPAVAPSAVGAPPMALTPATDAPDFYQGDDFVAEGGGGKSAVLKIVLGLLLVLGTAAAVVLAVRFLGGEAETEVPAGPLKLVLASSPEKIEVFDGGRYVAETPFDFEIGDPKAGHDLRFARQSSIFTAAVGPISEQTWAWVKLPDGDEPKALGTILVVSEPAGPVTAGGKPVGQTPLLLIAAPGEKIDLTVDAGGQPRAITTETKIGGGRIDAAAP